MVHREVHESPRTLLERVSLVVYRTMRNHPLFIWLSMGFSGVLLDADHFASFYLQMGRPFHLPVFFIVWSVFICYFTYHFRLNRNSVKFK